MKIPLHALFESLGLKKLKLDTPEDKKRFHEELDLLIMKAEEEEAKEIQKDLPDINTNDELKNTE